MTPSRPSSRRLAIANFFGTLGYISLLIQWVWTVLVLAYPYIMSGAFENWLNSLQARQSTHIPAANPTDFGVAAPLVTVVVVAVTILIVVFSIVALARLPKNISKTGVKITHSTANAIIPAIAQSQELPKSKRRKLSLQLVATTKFILTILALALLLFAQPIVQLSPRVIWAIGWICFSFTMLYWFAQYSISWRVSRGDIW